MAHKEHDYNVNARGKILTIQGSLCSFEHDTGVAVDIVDMTPGLNTLINEFVNDGRLASIDDAKRVHITIEILE